MDAPRNAKKRKFTDKNLPNAILHSPDFQDSKLYQDLLSMERKLDWTTMRKKMEIQDLFGKTPSTTRTLRIFLSHTVSDQLWQREGNPSAEPNFESGSGIPSWSFKIEGRLLEVPSRNRDKASPRKFSTMVKSLVVDLERDPNLYTDGNIVEWHHPQNQNTQTYALDGFNVRRTGDTPVKIRVIIHLDQYPEQFKVDPELSSIIEVKSDSRPGVIAALWNYIKVHNLQDKTDRRLIRTDARLRKLAGGAESIHFQHIPELVHRYLKVPDPVILHYTIRPNEPPPTQPQAWDVEVLMEDTNFKGRLNSVLMSLSSESAREITQLDEESLVLAQQIHNSALKRDFLNTFASDPANFIQTWLASQSRDLESVLGSGPSEGRTVREEELKRSEFFTLPWVEEAVAVQEGMRLASRGML